MCFGGIKTDTDLLGARKCTFFSLFSLLVSLLKICLKLNTFGIPFAILTDLRYLEKYSFDYDVALLGLCSLYCRKSRADLRIELNETGSFAFIFAK